MHFSEKQLEILLKNNQTSNRITKQAILDALFLLMAEKDFEKITITEIINRSGISRSAFYRNFKTKEDILSEQINEVMTSVLLSLSKSHFNNWILIFQSVRENKNKLDALIQAGLEYKLYERLMSFPFPEETMDSLSYHIWIGIIYSVIMDWAKRGMIETNEEMTFKTLLALNGIEKIIQKQE